MKIIGKSSLDDVFVADLLVCDNVNEFLGRKIVNFLNRDQDSAYYYELVSDDYKLYCFEPYF